MNGNVDICETRKKEKKKKRVRRYMSEKGIKRLTGNVCGKRKREREREYMLEKRERERERERERIYVRNEESPRESGDM